MDIKTKLEDDKVLKMSHETKKFLNSKGIYTIEDFLNIEESKIPVTRGNYYLAMQHIFRNAYLNQELVYDVLLEKEYKIDKENIKECSKDLIKLGLIGKDYSSSISSNIKKWIEADPKFSGLDKFSMPMVIEKCIDEVIDYENPNIETRIEKLRKPRLCVQHTDILNYYKRYMDVKNEKNSKNIEDTYTLIYLKEQIENLTSQRDNLDKQIEVLQNKVNELMGVNKTNGK